MTRPQPPADGPYSAAATATAWTGGLLFVASLAYFLYAYLVIFGRPAEPGPALLPAAIDILLFSGFALHHSAFARTSFRAWVRRVASPRLERSIYVWISSVLLFAVCWLWRPVPGELYRLSGAWWWLGLAVQAAGIAITLVGSRALDPLELAGLRSFYPSRAGDVRLITSGLYGIVRHPLYFGWALLVFGTPHMTMTRFVFAVVSTAYLMVAIPWEERGLVATFGEEYERYRRKVRWRMLPLLY